MSENTKTRNKIFNWTPDRVEFLRENYPKKGKEWCASAFGIKEHIIRYKVSSLGLVARGVSEAWRQGIKKRSKTITGRKRPAQADVMRKAIVDKGLHIPDEEARKNLSEKVKLRIAESGHPRGMLGKTHSESSREKMSASGQARANRESSDVVEERTMKGIRTKADKGILSNQRKNVSWKSGWRNIGGIEKYYRSRWEANYARYLEWLKLHGEILTWEHEPETFWFDGIKRGCVSYLPDFRVTENSGKIVYHEVKGWMDDRSKTKIQRMAKYHPKVTLIVIDSKAYKSIASKAKLFVIGWE